jgi:hypothetical protein
MLSRPRTAKALGEPTPLFVDRNVGMAALVRVDPDGHHARCLLQSMGGQTPDRLAGISQ